MLEKNSGKQILPKARTKDIVINKVGNETLVYDTKTNKAHNLNETITIVWDYCDGNTTFDQIAKVLSEKLCTKIEDDFILLALEELEETNLIEADFVNYDVSSRRDVLFRYALPAVAAPIIMSLIAPSVVHAQSCLAPNVPCTGNPIPCCPGTVCNEGICQ